MLFRSEGRNQASLRASEPVTVQVEGQEPAPFKQDPLNLGTVPPGERRVLLGEGKDRLGELDYESAGRERRRIQEEEDALSKEFRATVPPDAARTGTGIGNTTVPNRYGESAGDTILRPSTGSDIAGEQEQSLRPRAGMDTQSSTLTPRHGSENQDTTLPSSTGFEAGGAQGPTGSSNTPTRAGPNIGDSNLNQSR